MSVPAGKYLAIDNATGNTTESSGVTSSAGSGDASKIVLLNSSGLIDSTMLAAAISASAVASESIAAGALINLWSNAGVLNVRNADQTAIGKRAHGFAQAAISSAATGIVVLTDGVITGLSGLVVGTEYFLGTAGAVTATVPTGTGTVLQKVGVARSTTELEFELLAPIVRA